MWPSNFLTVFEKQKEVPMRTRPFTLLAIILAVSVLMLGASAQAADHQVGTWKLDVAKSKYSPGPGPKESTLKIEAQADGLKFTIDGIDAEGKTIHIESSPKYDGTDSPVIGNPNADSISLKKINDHTIETVSKQGGNPVMTIRSVVSKDGKTRTSTYKGKNAKGQDVNNTTVSIRQ
jgi:hypothetical protein